MSDVGFTCPRCGGLLSSDQHSLGSECPYCGEVTASPGADASASTTSIQPDQAPVESAPVSESAGVPEEGAFFPDSQLGEPNSVSVPPDMAAQTAGDSQGPPGELPFHVEAKPRPVQRGLRGSVLIVGVLIPLISYSVLATIAVIILYSRPPPPHPLEFLPDLEGDLKGAKRDKPSPVSYERPQPDVALPPHLQVDLGRTLLLGQLEVRPLKVERRRLNIGQPGEGFEPASQDSLVLHIRFRNCSDDVTFSPTDPYFDRRWKGPSYGGKPYTFLEIGDQRFYGGSIPWKKGQSLEDRERIEGQEFRFLRPSEELTTLVCSDPTDPLVDILESFHGPIVWRIQVRRGLAHVGDREIPATAVVGVRFTDRDIEGLAVERAQTP
jgi:hypothetical protein